MKKLCIYHKNCPDGFGAAWVVRKKFGEDNVEFYPATHGDMPPSNFAEWDQLHGRIFVIQSLKPHQGITEENNMTQQNQPVPRKSHSADPRTIEILKGFNWAMIMNYANARPPVEEPK